MNAGLAGLLSPAAVNGTECITCVRPAQASQLTAPLPHPAAGTLRATRTARQQSRSRRNPHAAVGQSSPGSALSRTHHVRTGARRWSSLRRRRATAPPNLRRRGRTSYGFSQTYAHPRAVAFPTCRRSGLRQPIHDKRWFEVAARTCPVSWSRHACTSRRRAQRGLCASPSPWPLPALEPRRRRKPIEAVS